MAGGGQTVLLSREGSRVAFKLPQQEGNQQVGHASETEKTQKSSPQEHGNKYATVHESNTEHESASGKYENRRSSGREAEGAPVEKGRNGSNNGELDMLDQVCVLACVCVCMYVCMCVCCMYSVYRTEFVKYVNVTHT